MSILDMNEKSTFPLVGSEYDVQVCTTSWYSALKPFMKNDPHVFENNIMQWQDILELVDKVKQLESIGPDMSNIKELIRDITTNHEELIMDTKLRTDMWGNTIMWALHINQKGWDTNLISVMLKKK